jgi:hypothetical protein
MKNLLLQTAMLLISAASIAQLYVKPNGATNSYVYVNDEVIFVEQDVNLAVNNGGTTRASIYLRNQAQLVQGITSSANSGTGFISVFQNTPNDDSYDYSYWCPPVGAQHLGASGNQNFGIYKISDSLSNTHSALTNITVGVNGWTSPLTISTRWLYTRGSGAPFTAIGTTYGVTPGLGFTMKGTETINHNQLYDFRGRPNNGNIDIPVVANRVVLSGNPYPSALDLNRVFWDVDNTEITEFRYWDEDRTIQSHLYLDNKGGYGTYVPGASDPSGTSENGLYTAPTFLHYDGAGNPSGSTGINGNVYDRRFAPIGQGFMIYTSASGTITLKNSHRRYIVEGAANSSIFRKGEPGTSNASMATDPSTGVPVIEPDNRIPHIRINAFFGESHFRDLVLALSDESTDGFDRGFDGKHPMDATIAEAYFPVAIGQDTNVTPFVIQTVPYSLTKQIPITFTLDEPFDLKVLAVEEINLPTNNAFLWDKTTNIYHAITGGNQANIYLPAGEYAGRFFIVFRNSTMNNDTGIDTESMASGDLGKSEAEVIQASVDFFQNNRAAQLEVSNPDGYNIKAANIFDMSGKLVISEKNIGNVTNFSFSTANLSDGVYLVKLTTVDNVDIDYKITIHNKR